ncbi:flagellar hook-basal body complex protein FliE [Verticiella sediminum]|uniref:Flagellar hook-basal body complex protein FliE n=1 Tax=Verticiella sediminum TaxID=1247510 RepID=A0A556ARW0_9BURK|nr:flagellar hook-basal body complex protein FliE [Verticiella sediminum]TSH95658.1 flagellar hook-basal body complex protein FliE [Verticiella sediminum]
MDKIGSVIQQMHQLAEAAGSRAPARQATAPASFADELQRSLARVSQAQEAAYAKAQAFELGEPGVALSDVMIDMQKAGIAFQTTLQVRNRLVSAYQEISSMPV